LAGSIPFGLLVARMKGVDIRKQGSGNIGATNVYRSVGKPYGVAVFCLDFVKGWLPVLAAIVLHVRTPGQPDAQILPILTALAAILGHNYSPWVGFKGGKGVATSAGALLGLFPVALVIGLLVWYSVMKISRYVSVGSIAAALTIPTVVAVQQFLLWRGSGRWDPYALGFSVFIGALAIWRHRSNIRKLMDGSENRIGPN
jgi:glycerol-3-phosphate acyltransferase PlsY